jgi:type VI secretion system protein ImpL
MEQKPTYLTRRAAAKDSRTAVRRVAAGALGLVKDRLSQAERLVSARGGNQKPWYIALGPANTGTTTWLRAAAGSGRWTGDRNLSGAPLAPVELVCCDAALVADIAGSLISQDLDKEVEGVIWRGVLRHLRSVAAGRMAGILLFIEASGSDLGEMEDAALSARLEEIRTAFGPLPIYLIVTKLDRLPGYGAFFAGLEGDIQERPYGALLSAGASPPTPPGQLFDQLLTRLSAQTIFRLQATDIGAQGAGAFGFPAAFAQMREPLIRLLNRLMPRDPERLRGIFFSASPTAGAGRARVAFARDVLSGVVAQEAGLAKPAKHRLVIRILASAAMAVSFLVGGLSVLATDHRDQVSALARMEEGIGRASRHLATTSVTVISSQDPNSVLPVLDRLAEATGAAGAAPILLTDHAALAAAAARAAYRAALAKLLTPRLGLAIEEAMRQHGIEPGILDDAALKGWLESVGWPTPLEKDAVTLRHHLSALLRHGGER